MAATLKQVRYDYISMQYLRGLTERSLEGLILNPSSMRLEHCQRVAASGTTKPATYHTIKV
jgi:hypothetical protein